MVRLLRLLCAAGILAEGSDGRFELAEAGQYLRSDVPDSMRAVALQFAGPLQQRTWTELEHSVRTGTPVFPRVAGVDVFSFFAQNPSAAEVFNASMAFFGGQVGAALVGGGYDFSRIETLMDVGGGHGTLLTAVLRSNPRLRGILFELPHVAGGARDQLEAAGLSDRCEVVSGDFFADQIPAGADAYMLKSVIHDFPDDRATQILDNCRRAMGDTGRLLLVEPMIADRVDGSAGLLRVAGSDINMLVHMGGRERTKSDFHGLVQRSGFELARITPLEQLPSGISGTSHVIEAHPA